MSQTKTIGKKQTLIALAVFGVALLLAIVNLQSNDAKLVQQTPPSPLASIGATQIHEIHIATPNEEKPIVIVKDMSNNRWNITSPIQALADNTLIDEVIKNLVSLRFDSKPAAEHSNSWETLGVLEEQTKAITLINTKKQSKTIHIGTRDYIRLDSSDNVYRVSNLDKESIIDNVHGWRNRQVLKIPADDIRVVVLEEQTKYAELTHTKTKDDKPQWTLTQGAQFVGALDSSIGPSLVRVLSDLRATSIVDGITHRRAGMMPPKVVVTVTLADQSSEKLLIGNQTGNNTYIGRPDNKHIWTIPTATIQSISGGILAWRDKSIMPFSSTEINQIKVKRDKELLIFERQDSSWKINKPKGYVLNDKYDIERMTGVLGSIKINRFVATNKKNLRKRGLNPPKIHITAINSENKSVTLSLGNTTANEVYAISSNRPELFLIPSYITGMFDKPWSELAKKQ